MKNLKKMIQAVTIATVLLGTAKVSHGDQLQLACGGATIFAGFKFKLSSCKKNETSELSIANTYDNRRKLTIEGNFIIKNGKPYHVYDGSISVIDFNARGALAFNVNSKKSGYGMPINTRSVDNLKPTKSISISCKSGTKRIAGVIITPNCSGQTPRFFVENTTNNYNNDKWVAYQGVRGAFKFKNFKQLNLSGYNRGGSQHKFDLSIISKPNRSSSQAYTFMIY